MAQRQVKFKDKMLNLVGPQLKPGDAAPDFRCVTSALTLVGLADTPAKARLFSVVPSLDTPVCHQQTKKFEEALAGLKDKLASYTISLDSQPLRRYPAYGPDGKSGLAASVLGFADYDNQGHYGVEEYYNSQLAGEAVHETIARLGSHKMRHKLAAVLFDFAQLEKGIAVAGKIDVKNRISDFLRRQGIDRGNDFADVGNHRAGEIAICEHVSVFFWV